MPLSKEGLKKNASPKDIFQFRDGDNTIRILPPNSSYFTEYIDFIAYKFMCHYNVGPEGSPPVVCPRMNDTKEKKHRCPICDAARRLRRNPATKELAKDLGNRTRYIMNVIDMEHPERGIQVCEVGPSIYDKIFEVAIDREYGDVLDLQAGRNFKVTLTPANRSKTGFNSYSVLAGANPSSVKELLSKGWKDKINELGTRVGTPPSTEELARLANEATGGQGGGDDGESEGTPPRNARTRRAAASEEFIAIGKEKDSVVKEGSDGSPADDVDAGSSNDDGDGGGEVTTDEEKSGGTGETKTVEGKPAEAPDCWGTDLQPSSERCKSCKHREGCVEKYLEG